MAANVPIGLKSVDISRFANRAAQLEKAKPVVAYWCNFWIVNQILSKSLQRSDSDCMNYTLGLMDKLERVKAENAENDAVTDEVAGRAYVEQFGLETFQRAENAVRANKASRQTADTFQAAATFLDLSHIWGTPEQEIAAKSKYAKFHALRIAKAIKAGEDPNLSNPVQEPPPSQEGLPHDPSDAELGLLINQRSGGRVEGRDMQPAVEDVPDEHDRLQRSLAARSSLDESLHPSRSTSIPRSITQPTQQYQSYPTEYSSVNQYYRDIPPKDDVSPLEQSPVDQKGSDSGGYFPSIPNFASHNQQTAQVPSHSPRPPSASDPSDMSSTLSRSESESRTLQQSILPASNSFQSFPEPYSSAPPPPNHPSYPTQNSLAPSEPPDETLQNYYHQFAEAQKQPMPQKAPISVAAPVPQENYVQGNVVVDEEAILKAQKHARWAISALNFEDVVTAAKELKAALSSLGER